MTVCIKRIYEDKEPEESIFNTNSITALHHFLTDVVYEEGVVRVEATYHFVPNNCHLSIDRKDTKV